VQAVYRTLRKLSSELERLISSILSRLTEKTQYMAYITVPALAKSKIKSVNLIEVDRYQLVIVLVTDAQVAQSRVVTTDVPVQKLMIGLLNERLNNYFRGKAMAEVNFAELRKLLSDFAGSLPFLYSHIESLIKGAMAPRRKVLFTEAYTLLSQPEFEQAGRFRTIIESLTDEENFLSIIDRGSRGTEVDAIIGEETGKDELKDISILVSPYDMKDGEGGKLGLVGPTRLDYEKTLSVVLNIAEALSRTLADQRGKTKK